MSRRIALRSAGTPERPRTWHSIWKLRFTPEDGGTRVELTHAGWEALGEEAQSVRDSYDRGWVKVFEQCYREYVNALA